MTRRSVTEGTSSRTTCIREFNQRTRTQGLCEPRLERRHEYPETCGAADKTRSADAIQLCGAPSHTRILHGDAEADGGRPVGNGLEASVWRYIRITSMVIELLSFTDRYVDTHTSKHAAVAQRPVVCEAQHSELSDPARPFLFLSIFSLQLFNEHNVFNEWEERHETT